MILPALIDCHVHFREPGLEHKATIASEGAAARAGGVSIVCEMPNTIPPTTTVERFAEKVSIADKVRAVCDARFFFGATELAHLDELRRLFTDEALVSLKKHCSGLKLYLDNSTGDQKSDDVVTEEAFKVCAELKITLVAHCEHSATNDSAAGEVPYCDPCSHSHRRPAKSEVVSIGEAIDRARRYGTQLHIAHLSTAGGLELVVAAKKEGLSVTCEVTPHHLFLSMDDYKVLGARAKVNPPIRSFSDTEALWTGLVSGDVDCVSTDHAPHLLEEKAAPMPPSGLPGVEVALRLLLSQALGKWPHPSSQAPVAAQKLTLEHIRETMFTNPNKIFSLNADPTPRLHINPDVFYEITDEKQLSKCGWTPYNHWVVKGDYKLQD